MSGGSFNYLCNRDAGALFERQGDIQEMADDLARLGYAPDAAKETQALLLELRASLNRIEASRDRLAGVWKALEWWRSGDWGEDDVKAALSKYRDGGPK